MQSLYLLPYELLGNSYLKKKEFIARVCVVKIEREVLGPSLTSFHPSDSVRLSLFVS